MTPVRFVPTADTSRVGLSVGGQSVTVTHDGLETSDPVVIARLDAHTAVVRACAPAPAPVDLVKAPKPQAARKRSARRV